MTIGRESVRNARRDFDPVTGQRRYLGRIVGHQADLRKAQALEYLRRRRVDPFIGTEAKRFGPSRMMRQLADAMVEELDFTNEARNADRLRTDFANEPSVVVPEIHWEWTSETLLVMDYINGVPPSNAQALVAAGLDPTRIAALGADMVLDMILVNGRFHGDPHPGNLLCLPGNHIALLDLGMVGYVSPRRREEFVSFVQALSTGSPAQLADVLTYRLLRKTPGLLNTRSSVR